MLNKTKKITIIAEIINQRNNKLSSYFRNRTSHPDIERILSKMENVFGIQNRDEQISDQRVQNSVNNIRRTPTRIEYLDNPQSTAQVPISGVKFQYTSLNEKENYEFYPAPQYGNIDAKFEFGSQNTKWSAHQIITCEINYFHMTPDNNSKFKHIPQLAPYLDTHQIEKLKLRKDTFLLQNKRQPEHRIEVNTQPGKPGVTEFLKKEDPDDPYNYLLVLKIHDELLKHKIRNVLQYSAYILKMNYSAFESKLRRARNFRNNKKTKKSKCITDSDISSYQLSREYQIAIEELVAEHKKNGYVEIQSRYKKSPKNDESS